MTLPPVRTLKRTAPAADAESSTTAITRLPSGRETILTLVPDPLPPRTKRSAAAAAIFKESEAGSRKRPVGRVLRVDLRVEGDAPLSRADLESLACKVINVSARYRRMRLGCTQPFKHLLTVSDVYKELSFLSEAHVECGV